MEKLFLFFAILMLIFSINVQALNVSGEIRTIFDKAYYGSNDYLTAQIWSQEEILDLKHLQNDFGQTTDDIWNLPQNEFFIQEYDFLLAKELAAETNLYVELIAQNHFVENKRKVEDDKNEHQNPARDLILDKGKISLIAPTYRIQIGHLDNVVAEDYFLSGKDLEGFDLKRKVAGFQMRIFGGGYNPDYLLENDPHYDRDFYGIVFAKELESIDFAAKYYFINDNELFNIAPDFKWQINDRTSFDFEFVYNYCYYISDYYRDELAPNAEIDAQRNDILIDTALNYEVDNYNLELSGRSIGDDFQLVYDNRLEAGVDELGLKLAYPSGEKQFGFRLLAREGEKRRYFYGVDFKRLFANGVQFNGDYELSYQTGDFANRLFLNSQREYQLTDNLSLPTRLAGQWDTRELNYVFVEAGMDYQISLNSQFNFKLNYLAGHDKLKDSKTDGNRLYIEYLVQF